MIISVINHSGGSISDGDVQTALRSVNRQIAEDFALYWSLGATLRLEGKSTRRPQTTNLQDMRGDAVLYLWDETDVDDALGYHDQNNRGIPFGFVFTKLAEQLHESWTVTLSHEALELIADPEVNLLVQGPHPSRKNRYVFFWYEMCDPVQAESYEIDGVAVSNFVLPLYFTGQDESGGRNDFIGGPHRGRRLHSFGINPGGYVGFYDPATGKDQTVSLRNDREAERRMKLRSRFAGGRRSVRYQRFRRPRLTRGRGRIPLPRFGPVPGGVDVL